jgi:hypothetical protein
MKTCRNIRRNKTRRKGRITYKTRKYGGVKFNREAFLKVDRNIRAEKEKKEKEEKEKQELLNQLRIESNIENSEKNNTCTINNKTIEEQLLERQIKANALKQKKQQKQLDIQKVNITEIRNRIKRNNPNEFSKSESTYNELKQQFTEYKDTSFDDFLSMFNDKQIKDIYNNKFDTNYMILFYLHYFSGNYYIKDKNKIKTYREYVIVSK